MNTNRKHLLDAANQAVNAGQLEQAVRLLASGSSHGRSDRRLAIELHQQLKASLEQAMEEQAWARVIGTWQLLQELEGESQELATLKRRWEELLTVWGEDCLKQGKWEQLGEVYLQFGAAQLVTPEMQKKIEAIETLRSAKKLAVLGRFAEAEGQLSQMLDRDGQTWLQSAIHQLRSDHEKAKTLLTEIHRAAEANRWQDVADQSESLLSIASKHPVAIQMGQRAKAELAALGVRPTREKETPKMAVAADLNGSQYPISKPSGEPLASPKAPILWIDGVGGYLLLDATEVIVGQAAPGNAVDLMIVGDLSRRAAAIRRSGEDHLLQPLQPLSVNSQRVDRATLLRDGDIISLSPRVLAKYVRPNRLSATSRIELLSRHRWQPSVDGVLLMGDSCVLGPGSTSHVLCPFWTGDVILFRHRGQWMCKSALPLEVDGKSTTGAIPLLPGKRIQGFDFSMTLE